MIDRIPEPWELQEKHDNELEHRQKREMEQSRTLHKRLSKNYAFAEYLSEAEKKLEDLK